MSLTLTQLLNNVYHQSACLDHNTCVNISLFNIHLNCAHTLMPTNLILLAFKNKYKILVNSNCIQIPLQSPVVSSFKARGHHINTVLLFQKTITQTHTTVTVHWGFSTVFYKLLSNQSHCVLHVMQTNQYEQRSMTTFISLSVRCQSKSNYKGRIMKSFIV